MSPYFTTLPVEVRSLIYSHVFDHTSATLHHGDTGKSMLLSPLPGRGDGFYNKCDPQEILALLYISRQI